jgi:serine/threonine-protein kinase RsbT
MEKTLTVTAEIDSLTCGQTTVGMAMDLGFDRRSANEIAIAVSELVSNSVKYGGGGTLTLRSLVDPEPGIEIAVEDMGPGIPDGDAVFQDGFSEGRVLTPDDRLTGKKDLGIGLGAVRRLMHTVELTNNPGGGAKVIARRFIGKPPSAR